MIILLLHFYEGKKMGDVFANNNFFFVREITSRFYFVFGRMLIRRSSLGLFNVADLTTGVSFCNWKVKSLYLIIKYHLVLDGCEWSAPRPGRLNPGERDRGTYWVWCWLSPRAGPGYCGTEKNVLTLPEIQLLVSLYRLSCYEIEIRERVGVVASSN
jgi:hypothetical protein